MLASRRFVLCAILLSASGIAATGSDPASQRKLAVDRVLTQTLSRQIADLLEANYVDPGTGLRYARMLRSGRPGQDGEVNGAPTLARSLTAALQAVARDGHLRVIPPGEAVPVMRTVGRASGDAPRARRTGAVEAARWIAPGIAYIRLTSMAGDAVTTSAVERFARQHAEAKSIIIDARENPGGGSGPSDVLFPYFYSRPTVLVHMDTRAEPDAAGFGPFSDSPLVRRLPAPRGVVRRERLVHPHGSERRLFDAKIFYLTSRQTASAAETMALALKRTRRGTIVGERTRGAGNFGRIYPLIHGFNLFLPIGRTFDPDTGESFEGTGVAPDVAVPAQEALRETLKLAGLSDEVGRDAAVAAAREPNSATSTRRASKPTTASF